MPSVPYTYIDSVSKWNSTRPRTMILLCKATLLKVLAIGGDNFTEYILCPKCDSIYSPEYCKRVGMFAATAYPQLDKKAHTIKTKHHPSLQHWYIQRNAQMCSTRSRRVDPSGPTSQAMWSTNPKVVVAYSLQRGGQPRRPMQGLVNTEPRRSVFHHSPMPVYPAQCTRTCSTRSQRHGS